MEQERRARRSPARAVRSRRRSPGSVAGTARRERRQHDGGDGERDQRLDQRETALRALTHPPGRSDPGAVEPGRERRCAGARRRRRRASRATASASPSGRPRPVRGSRRAADVERRRARPRAAAGRRGSMPHGWPSRMAPLASLRQALRDRGVAASSSREGRCARHARQHQTRRERDDGEHRHHLDQREAAPVSGSPSMSAAMPSPPSTPSAPSDLSAKRSAVARTYTYGLPHGSTRHAIDVAVGAPRLRQGRPRRALDQRLQALLGAWDSAPLSSR